MNDEVFEILPEHLKLLSHMCVGWQDCEFGAPEIDPKRPYGNSSVEDDVIEILGWNVCTHKQCEMEEEHPELYARASKIHRDMEKVLQICLSLQTFEIGKYSRCVGFNDWRKI